MQNRMWASFCLKRVLKTGFITQVDKVEKDIQQEDRKVPGMEQNWFSSGKNKELITNEHVERRGVWLK